MFDDWHRICTLRCEVSNGFPILFMTKRTWLGAGNRGSVGWEYGGKQKSQLKRLGCEPGITGPWMIGFGRPRLPHRSAGEAAALRDTDAAIPAWRRLAGWKSELWKE